MKTLRGRMSDVGALRVHSAILLCTIAVLLIASPASAQTDVLTNRYDGARTGANLSETKLTAGNVSVDQFGKLYSYPVSGSVYAQPLYVRNVVIGGASRNVLYVATMNDKVYAFNADSSSATPFWTRDLAVDVGGTPVPIKAITGSDGLNIVGNVGIQSTPVIDAASGTIYLVARTLEAGEFVQRLHALDIATGASRPGSGRIITATAGGTGADSVGSVVTFNPKMQSQRAGLALSNGVVLIAWAAHEDFTPYHGWIMAYDSSTLNQVGSFIVTRDYYEGGIWQGGRAPTLDAAGNAYFATGNGMWDGARNWGDSLIKFSVSRAGLTPLDYFTPGNEDVLSRDDDDLSGSGFTLLPGNLLLGGGKEGVLYLLNANDLGGKGPVGDPQIPQRISVRGGHVMGGVVYWNSAVAGPLVYNWSEDDELKSYSLLGAQLVTTPYAQGVVTSPGHPGGSLTLSANGNASGTGIVWASMPTSEDGIHGKVAGVLRAFDAETLREIWSSEQDPTRDRVGTLMKFVPPVVVNGKVYIPNHDGAVAVYGRLPVTKPDFTLSVAAPSTKTIPAGSSGTFPVNVTATNSFSGTVALSASGQPSGVTVGFSPSSVTGSGTSTMTVSLPSTAFGTFTITVTGVSGSLTHTATATVVVATAAPAGSIGVNFVGTSPTPMGASETAGVLVQANWNNATGATSSTPLALVDKAGAATAATVAWSANGIWMTPIPDTAGNARLMKGYLDSSSTSTTTVTVAGLAQRTYDVYVYADGDNKVYSRSAAYTISGTGITTTTVTLIDAPSTNFGGTFTRATNSAGNYVKFSITAAGFTLRATGTEPVDGSRRAPVNGIQIVPTASAAPDFTLSVTPSSRSVAQGGSTTYTATVTPMNGFSGTVTLALSGAPGGTTTTFNPATIAGSGSSTVTVSTSASTPAGTSTLTFKGTSGALSHTATASLTVGAAGGTAAGSIAINFVGTSPTPMGAAETAGVITQPNWNNATGANGSTPMALVDRTGAATSATVTWTAPGGTYMTSIADAAGNARMMKGYLDTTSTSQSTVNVAGLAQRTYDVYVYADGANGSSNRSGDYTISGTGITTTTVRLTDAASTNYSGTFTRANNSAGNYVQFTVTGSSFSITAKPVGTAGTTLRAPINGVQIVPVVVPPSSPPIGVSFVGSSPTPMAATETAGVVEQANWNNASGAASTTALALVNASGAASGATITWKANGAWSVPITDSAGNRRLMKGYLDTGSSTQTIVTVAGLAFGDYDVYVYTDGDNKDLTRTATYSVSTDGGTTIFTVTDPANTNFSGTFTEAVPADTSGNYVRFRITGSDLTLIARPATSTTATLRAPVNAIQIVPR